MTGNDAEKEDSTIYSVVVNHEEQYSIWPAHREIPRGWNPTGKTGPKTECLAHIQEVWTDMRPLSLRVRMAELERTPAAPPPVDPVPAGPSLVDRLSGADHPVELGFGTNRSLKLAKEAVDRGYVHVTFPKTRGGTSLGVKLDRDACDLAKGDFEAGAGAVHLEGDLILNFVKVRCSADVDLATLGGTGRLAKR
jgi:uncharacterized protein YbdZ (MbtH family)